MIHQITILDQHADTVEGDVKSPLVILGNEGSGKSAFLANWGAKGPRGHLRILVVFVYDD